MLLTLDVPGHLLSHPHTCWVLSHPFLGVVSPFLPLLCRRWPKQHVWQCPQVAFTSVTLFFSDYASSFRCQFPSWLALPCSHQPCSFVSCGFMLLLCAKILLWVCFFCRESALSLPWTLLDVPGGKTLPGPLLLRHSRRQEDATDRWAGPGRGFGTTFGCQGLKASL